MLNADLYYTIYVHYILRKLKIKRFNNNILTNWYRKQQNQFRYYNLCPSSSNGIIKTDPKRLNNTPCIDNNR